MVQYKIDTYSLTLICNCPPPLRRANALVKKFSKINLNHELPINNFIDDVTKTRLKHRNPSLKTAKDPININFNMMMTWKQTWAATVIGTTTSQITYHQSTYPQDVSYSAIYGAHLMEYEFRMVDVQISCTNGKWGMRNSPESDCRAEKQTIYHIAYECPVHAYRGPRIDCLTIPPTFVKWLEELNLKL